MATRKRKAAEAAQAVPSGVRIDRILPAVGFADPSTERGYAVKYFIHGFGPLQVVVSDWEKEHWGVQDVLACHTKIVDAIMSLPGVVVTHVSNPVLPHLGEPLHTFNVEFLYRDHGPFSVWEPLEECRGEHMVTRAQEYIRTIEKVLSLSVGG